jgi:hypothetical protein
MIYAARALLPDAPMRVSDSAIFVALSAAPQRTLSTTTQKFSPCCTVGSVQKRET